MAGQQGIFTPPGHLTHLCLPCPSFVFLLVKRFRLSWERVYLIVRVVDHIGALCIFFFTLYPLYGSDTSKKPVLDFSAVLKIWHTIWIIHQDIVTHVQHKSHMPLIWRKGRSFNKDSSILGPVWHYSAFSFSSYSALTNDWRFVCVRLSVITMPLQLLIWEHYLTFFIPHKTGYGYCPCFGDTTSMCVRERSSREILTSSVLLQMFITAWVVMNS